MKGGPKFTEATDTRLRETVDMQQDQKLKALKQRMQDVLGTYANNSKVMKQTIIAQSVEIERLRQLL